MKLLFLHYLFEGVGISGMRTDPRFPGVSAKISDKKELAAERIFIRLGAITRNPGDEKRGIVTRSPFTSESSVCLSCPDSP